MRKIAQITDIHLDDELAQECKIDARQNLQVIFGDIQRSGISELVFTGDLGRAESLPWLKESTRSFGFACNFLVGNHDSLADMVKHGLVSPANVTDQKLYYSAADTEQTLLFLDSSDYKIQQQQMQWLGEQLESARRNVIIFLHHPVLDCGNSTMDRMFPLHNRTEIADLLHGCNKSIIDVFCGHYHTTHEQTLGNIRQHVTPSVLVQLKTDTNSLEIEGSRFGYRIITMDGPSIQSRVVLFDDDGQGCIRI